MITDDDLVRDRERAEWLHARRDPDERAAARAAFAASCMRSAFATARYRHVGGRR